MPGQRTAYLGVALAMLVSAVPVVAQDKPDAAVSQATYTEYSVKFVCGIQAVPNQDGVPRETVKPGNYATEINIHNPQPDIIAGSTESIRFIKQAVQAAPEGAAKAHPSPAVNDVLLAGETEFVDCTTIRNLLNNSGTTFITGFVTILVPVSSVVSPVTANLDVVAVYSSEPPPVAQAVGVPESLPGISLRVVTVQPETITLPSPTS